MHLDIFCKLDIEFISHRESEGFEDSRTWGFERSSNVRQASRNPSSTRVRNPDYPMVLEASRTPGKSWESLGIHGSQNHSRIPKLQGYGEWETKVGRRELHKIKAGVQTRICIRARGCNEQQHTELPTAIIAELAPVHLVTWTKFRNLYIYFISSGYSAYIAILLDKLLLSVTWFQIAFSNIWLTYSAILSII